MSSSRPIDQTTPPEPTDQFVDRFIVCGMGSLGQHCVLNLKHFSVKSFEVSVMAIDWVQPFDWEVQDLPDLLDHPLIVGDCRNDKVLLQAGIQHCRAILLVTSNDSVNVEAALVARRLNPTVRLVVRSSRQNLNQLLHHQLGNFVAFNSTELPATAFALAGLNEDILGYFKIGDYQLQVIEQQVQPKDYRFDGTPVSLLHKRSYRLLSYRSIALPTTQLTSLDLSQRSFHQWDPEAQLQAGDTIAYIEMIGKVEQLSQNQRVGLRPQQRRQHWWQMLWSWITENSLDELMELKQWLRTQRNAKTIGIGLASACLMWIVGTVLLKTHIPTLSWAQALSHGAILLLGGYGDIFGGIDPETASIPDWVLFVCLGITLFSFLFILGVFGLIADSILATRFDFLRKRPPIPKQNHIVIIGFGRLGQRVAQLLQQFRQPVVALTEQTENARTLTQIPLVVGDLITELPRVNLATAKGVMLLTDDPMLNLEVALIAKNIAQQTNRTIGIVVRTYGQRFSDSLHQLLPDAKAMAAYALSAEAFAGAAFGENILGLFRLNQSTILVTEYLVEPEDTLVNRLLAEVAYGYGVMPIFHQKAGRQFPSDMTECFMPSDDLTLEVGDRLILLASLHGLRRIEHGERLAPSIWRLAAQQPLNAASLLDAGSTLYRISGYHLDSARNFMKNLPGTLDLPLYEHQAYRLRQELNHQLPVTLTPIDPRPQSRYQ